MIKKTLRWIGLVVVGLALIGLAVAWAFNEIRPVGEEGEAADALARKMERSLGIEEWEETGVVRFEFFGGNQHLWDRERHLERVSWGNNTVWVNLTTRTGVAEKKGQRLDGKERDEMVEEAIKRWNNDTFWLSAAFKAFDPGVRRELVLTEEGDSTLVVHYQTGGTTPGDSYQWFFDETGKPSEWKMWVSVIPIGGIAVSYDTWIQTETGVTLPTKFGGLGSLELKGVETAMSVDQWFPEGDPFWPLFSGS